MNPRPIIVGLIIAVVALGFWVDQIAASMAVANKEIAALNKNVATAQHDASAARAENAKQREEMAGGRTAPRNAASIAKNPVPVNPQTALAQAQEMPPGSERDNALQTSLLRLAASDPQAAWDLAKSAPDFDAATRLQTLRFIVRTWNATDPAQAAALVTANSLAESSNSPTNLVGTIETTWLKKDPDAAVKWIDTLPAGGPRDSALQAVGTAAMEDHNYPIAFAWVSKMDDPARRSGLVNPIIREWAKTDPEAATKAVTERYGTNQNRLAVLLGVIKESADNAAADAARGSPPAQ